MKRHLAKIDGCLKDEWNFCRKNNKIKSYQKNFYSSYLLPLPSDQ